MRPGRHLGLFILLLAITGAGWLLGARRARRDEAELVAMRQRVANLTAELAAQRLRPSVTREDIALAESQLAQLPPGRPDSIPPERMEIMVEWFARYRRLKEFFVERPDQAIPALRLVDDKEWLWIANRLPLTSETEIRQAMALVRGTATENLYRRVLSRAVEAMAKEGRKAMPRSGDALLPYLQNPADADLLSNLTFVPDEERGPGAWKITDKAPLDPVYDTRFTFDIAEGAVTSSTGPVDWLPEGEARHRAAAAAYQAAHPGKPVPDMVEPLLEYFDPPLDPAVEQGVRDAEAWRSK